MGFNSGFKGLKFGDQLRVYVAQAIIRLHIWIKW